MAGLKQCVKQILVNKQHRAYDREVKARNLSYDRWIREKEDKLGIEESISEQNARSLTNDFLTTVFEGKYKKNEGNNSDFDDFCRKLSNICFVFRSFANHLLGRNAELCLEHLGKIQRIGIAAGVRDLPDHLTAVADERRGIFEPQAR